MKGKTVTKQTKEKRKQNRTKEINRPKQWKAQEKIGIQIESAKKTAVWMWVFVVAASEFSGCSHWMHLGSSDNNIKIL